MDNANPLPLPGNAPVEPRHINSMPEYCLLAIFERLPLKDLLKMDKVCSYWQLLQHKSGLTKRRLTLLLGDVHHEASYDSEKHFDVKIISYSSTNDPRETQNYEHFQLQYLAQEEFADICDKIASILPNIKTLVVTQHNISSMVIQNVMSLLLAYSSKLTTLKIFGSYQDDFSYNQERIFISCNVFHLIHTINSLQCLQNLEMQFTLDIAATLDKPINLPILSRVQKFAFYACNDLAYRLYSSFLKYAQNSTQLQEIALGNHIHNGLTLDSFLKFTPELASRFYNLQIILSEPITQPQLSRFGRLFTSLRSLTLNHNILSITELAKCLAPIRSLRSLLLYLNFSARPEWSVDDGLDVSRVAPLSSLEELTLQLCATSHQNMASTQLAIIFPQLKIVKTQSLYVNCPLCKSSNESNEACVKRLFEPWRQCPQLLRIVADEKEVTYDKM